MADEKTIIMAPDSGAGNAGLASMFGGLNGLGGFNNIYDLFGLALVASIFGWGNFGGNGFGGFGGGAGAGFLSNQLDNTTGRELLMNAITAQGEASRTAIQTLSTALGQDFNLVNGGIQSIQNTVQNLALQQAVSVPQILAAIASGDASIVNAYQQCCCENRLAMCQQTNALQSDIAGVRTAIEAKSAADQLAICQQTYNLTDAMNRNYLALDNKIDALESSRKDREITSLTAQVAKLESQNFTAGVVQQAVAPVNIALNALAKEVDDIKCKQPSTVSVQYPNLVAMNVTPYMGGYYGTSFNGYGYGPGWGGSYWG